MGASCKCHDLLREKQAERGKEALTNGKKSGCGLNQEVAPVNVGDTHWRSYYRSLMNVLKLFDAIMDVLEFIELEGETSTIRNKLAHIWLI